MKLKKPKPTNLRFLFLIGAIAAVAFTSSCSPKTAVAGTNMITAEHLAQGKVIFDNTCGKCHDLPNPTDHNAQDWVGIMNAIAPQAKLNEKQHEMVYNYIVSVKK